MDLKGRGLYCSELLMFIFMLYKQLYKKAGMNMYIPHAGDICQ